MISDVEGFARQLQSRPTSVMEMFDKKLEPVDALLLEQTATLLEKDANAWLDRALNQESEMLSDAAQRTKILANLEARRYIRRLLSGWVQVSLN
jgi:hypothetical protein